MAPPTQQSRYDVVVVGGGHNGLVAAGYLALADRIMGPGWANPGTFRLGASSLFETLMRARGL